MNKLFTPNQIWSNYNEEALPLELFYDKIQNYKIDDFSIIERACFFTSEIVEEQKVMAFIKLYYQDIQKKFPCVLLCQDTKNQIEKRFIEHLVKQGYLVAVFDYKGFIPNSKDGYFTRYPEILDFCNYREKNKELYLADPNVFYTSIYHYTLIARRALYLLKNDSFVDNENIAIIGLNYGSEIAWQTIAFAKNLKTAIMINNMGFVDYLLKNNNPHNLLYNDPKVENFKVSNASETYIKICNKPTLSIIATNNTFTPISKIQYSSALKNNHESIYTIFLGLDTCIQNDAYNLIDLWLKKYLKNQKLNISNNIKLSYQTLNSHDIKFKYNIQNQNDISSTYLLISNATQVSEIRGWEKIDIKYNIDEYTKTFYEKGIYYALLNVKYKNGATISSLPCEIKINEINESKIKKERIIFNTGMKNNDFIVKSTGFFTVSDSLKLIEKNNVKGITSKEKDASLITYEISKFSKQGEENYSLHFDLYSETNKDLQIKIQVLNNGQIEIYTANISIQSNFNWSSYTLDKLDFKNTDLQSLKSWKDAKTIEFTNFEGVLLNNIIWI